MASSASPHAQGWNLEHSYAQLPEVFFQGVLPTPVRAPELLYFNKNLASHLGLSDALHSPEGARIFAGNDLPSGAFALAQAYAGHQFGHFTTLGDGRAILLGEQIAPDGSRWDVQLKGPGETPYSRRGDGRAAVGPMLREVIISEAMAALGIPTTRSLAVAATGEPVHRQEVLPGAVLTRIAASHIRVGTFQWAAAIRQPDALRELAAYTLQRHYPGKSNLFRCVVSRQAALLAQWMSVGFIHGVMNTDNMALSGETIDYGPCAFMDHYHEDTVFSSIDHAGRYAYGNQPKIAQWNLARLAEAMLPLFDENEDKALEVANASLQEFASEYKANWLAAFRRKLGAEVAESLIHELLQILQAEMLDFTNTFASLSTGEEIPPGLADWAKQWRTYSPDLALMKSVNPAVIPRNHLVEAALQAASNENNLQPFQELLAVLANPFAHGSIPAKFTQVPSPAASKCFKTFCGT
jgi:serine/tyrosine/threonine adenylyltransferase